MDVEKTGDRIVERTFAPRGLACSHDGVSEKLDAVVRRE